MAATSHSQSHLDVARNGHVGEQVVSWPLKHVTDPSGCDLSTLAACEVCGRLVVDSEVSGHRAFEAGEDT